MTQETPLREGSRSGRNGSATLGTAVRQDGAAGAGAHTKTEAVLLGTTAVIRLKSPLAHCGNSKTVCSGLPVQGTLRAMFMRRNTRQALSVLLRRRSSAALRVPEDGGIGNAGTIRRTDD